MPTTKPSELDAALRHFAETYFAGVVGIEWDEACDHAEFMASKFRFDADRYTPNSDRVVADRLYGEACRYADM